MVPKQVLEPGGMAPQLHTGADDPTHQPTLAPLWTALPPPGTGGTVGKDTIPRSCLARLSILGN